MRFFGPIPSGKITGYDFVKVKEATLSPPLRHWRAQETSKLFRISRGSIQQINWGKMNMTTNELISVKDAGLQLGKRKQTIFKIIKRLGIDVQKRRDSASKNQFVAYITETDLGRIKEELSLRGAILDKESQGSSSFAETDEMGVFYLIQLEPDHDPCRFKVGFAVNMPDRLRAHRCAAPFSKVVKKWPCKRLWEKTAIDCITATPERLHTEVYRSQSLDDIIKKADDFFNLMPQPEKTK